jgi:ribosomal protein S1
MSTSQSWEVTKARYPLRSKVRGTVTEHKPFGVFVAIQDCPYPGLVQITDFKDQERMIAAEYPAIGSSVTCVVLGYKEYEHQIWLGMKPSQLASAATSESV